jgi:hypothetical protein
MAASVVSRKKQLITQQRILLAQLVAKYLTASQLMDILFLRLIFRAPLKTYQNRDEYNFDYEQGDSVHRRAGSPSCADTTQLRTKSVSV